MASATDANVDADDDVSTGAGSISPGVKEEKIRIRGAEVGAFQFAAERVISRKGARKGNCIVGGAAVHASDGAIEQLRTRVGARVGVEAPTKLASGAGEDTGNEIHAEEFNGFEELDSVKEVGVRAEGETKGRRSSGQSAGERNVEHGITVGRRGGKGGDTRGVGRGGGSSGGRGSDNGLVNWLRHGDTQ